MAGEKANEPPKFIARGDRGGTGSPVVVGLRLRAGCDGPQPRGGSVVIGGGSRRRAGQLSSSGFNRIPTAKLYVDDVAAADIADLSHIADSTLKAIWELMPYEPAEVGIAFANSPKPADARMGDPDAVRIDGVWQRLQLKGGGDEIFAVLGSSLAERYGEREK